MIKILKIVPVLLFHVVLLTTESGLAQQAPPAPNTATETDAIPPGHDAFLEETEPYYRTALANLQFVGFQETRAREILRNNSIGFISDFAEGFFVPCVQNLNSLSERMPDGTSRHPWIGISTLEPCTSIHASEYGSNMFLVAIRHLRQSGYELQEAFDIYHQYNSRIFLDSRFPQCMYNRKTLGDPQRRARTTCLITNPSETRSADLSPPLEVLGHRVYVPLVRELQRRSSNLTEAASQQGLINLYYSNRHLTPQNILTCLQNYDSIVAALRFNNDDSYSIPNHIPNFCSGIYANSDQVAALAHPQLIAALSKLISIARHRYHPIHPAQVTLRLSRPEVVDYLLSREFDNCFETESTRYDALSQVQRAHALIQNSDIEPHWVCLDRYLQTRH